MKSGWRWQPGCVVRWLPVPQVISACLCFVKGKTCCSLEFCLLPLWSFHPRVLGRQGSSRWESGRMGWSVDAGFSQRTKPPRLGGGGGKQLLCCSHPQRNLPRQTRTRSDASAMQNSCQVKRGEPCGPCLLCCGAYRCLFPSIQDTHGSLMDGEAPRKCDAWSSELPLNPRVSMVGCNSGSGGLH